jgi:hypothetical protein
MTGTALVDSAQHFFYGSQSPVVKAEAAYTIAQIYLLKTGFQDLQQAKNWIDKAVVQRPGVAKYTGLQTSVARDLQRHP